MNCQDNSRLKVPLPELCKTTDIGCVPITSGKPDCPPESDQLPLAYDKNSQTLWLFDCDTRKWIAFSKFQLGELDEVSLDNITNICSLLKIPVYYNPGSGTVQGSMPLADFADKLQKCLDLKSKVAVLPTGNVAFSIEGLDTLDPLYVKYVNLEVSGTGSETDPLVVKAQDPLVKWPKKTEEDVDNANQPMLAADLDGEMVRVPYPKKPCEYNKLTQSQVEGANEALIIGCVDESNVKIPYPPQPRDYDPVTQDQVDGSNNRWLIAVIDGKQVRIPFPKGVCEFKRKTKEEVASGTTDIIACVDGEASQIPLSALKDNINSGDKWICDLPCATPEELDSVEGFSIAVCIGGVMRQMFIDCGSGSGNKFPSIPVVCGPPIGPPAEGTPPLRVDCDGYLWAWDENTRIWIKIGGSDAPNEDVAKYSSIAGNINNKCSDTLIRGYYLDKNDLTAGYKHTKITPSELVTILDKCGLATDKELSEIFQSFITPLQYRLLYWSDSTGRGMSFQNVQLDENYFASYSVHNQQWEFGSGTVVQAYRPDYVPERPGEPATPVPRGGKITVRNPYDQAVNAVCYCSVSLPSIIGTQRITSSAYMLVTDDPTLSDPIVRQGVTDVYGYDAYSASAPTGKYAIVSRKERELSPITYFYTGAVSNPTRKSLSTAIESKSVIPVRYSIPANSSKDLYLRGWVSMYAPDSIYIPGLPADTRPSTISLITFGFTFTLEVILYPVYQ